MPDTPQQGNPVGGGSSRAAKDLMMKRIKHRKRKNEKKRNK